MRANSKVLVDGAILTTHCPASQSAQRKEESLPVTAMDAMIYVDDKTYFSLLLLWLLLPAPLLLFPLLLMPLLLPQLLPRQLFLLLLVPVAR